MPNGNRWNGDAVKSAMAQVMATAFFAALAAFVAIKVGLTEVRANQISMDKRMDRIENKLDRLSEHMDSKP